MTKEFINLYWSTKTSACYHVCCGRFVQISYRIAPRSEQMVQRNMTKSINSTTKSLQSTYLCHNDGMGMPNNRTQCSKMKIEKYTHTHRESKLFIRFLKIEPSNTIGCVRILCRLSVFSFVISFVFDQFNRSVLVIRPSISRTKIECSMLAGPFFAISARPCVYININVSFFL